MFKLTLFLGILTLLPITYIHAETIVRTGDAVSIADNQTVEGNFYAIGSTVALSGSITGDALMAGGNVTVNGTVGEDIFVLGGTVNLSASTTDDVRVIGGDVTISGPIGGSLIILGGRVLVLSSATVAGDVLVYGGDVTIDGTVSGAVLGTIERLRINGKVAKGINVTTPNLTLGDQADITGDVTYVSDRELTRGAGAVVTGSLNKNAVVVPATKNTFRNEVITFLISLFATLSIYVLARRRVEALAAEAPKKISLKLLVGFAVLFLVPIAVIILLVSVLGIFVGLIGLFSFFAVFLLTLPLMNIVAGALISHFALHKTVITVPSILLGAASIQVILLIPLVGYIVLAGLFLITLGNLILSSYRLIR